MIVNNIPKDKNHYDSKLKTFAKVDNKFSGSRRTIGESSNLAQIALSYHQSWPEIQKYDDYCSILSVLAQASIDSLKRTFSVDIAAEIDRIKEDMHIDKHGYPAFWSLIRPGFNKDKINPDIKCPMNCLTNFNPRKTHRIQVATPISEYLSIYPTDADIKLCKKVEELINKYNINLFSRSIESLNYNDSDYFYLITAFDDMVADIQKMTLGEKYIGLFSWLLNKVFSKDLEKEIDSEKFNNQLQTNKSVLLKTLYNVNKDVFLKCFEKNMTEKP